VRQAHFPAPDNAWIGTAQPLTSDNQISSDGFPRPETLIELSNFVIE